MMKMMIMMMMILIQQRIDISFEFTVFPCFTKCHLVVLAPVRMIRLQSTRSRIGVRSPLGQRYLPPIQNATLALQPVQPVLNE